MRDVTTKEKLAAIQHELALRRRALTRLVGEGKLTGAAADLELAVLEAIRDDYQLQADQEAH